VLLAQLDDSRRVDDAGDVVDIVVGDLGLGGRVGGLGRRRRALGAGKFGGQGGDLLLGDRSAAGAGDDSIAGAVLGKRGVGLLRGLARGVQAVGQPSRLLGGGVDLGLDAGEQIFPREGVGDVGRLSRVEGVEADRDDVGGAEPGDIEVLQHPLDRKLRGGGGGGAAKRRPTVPEGGVELRIVGQIQGAHDLAGDIRRLDDLNLAVDKRLVGRCAAGRGVQIDGRLLGRIDADIRHRLVGRPQDQGNYDSQQHTADRNRDEEFPAPREGVDKPLQVKGLLVGLRENRPPIRRRVRIRHR